MTMIHPQFDTVALSLGPLQIHWYGLMYLLGFYLAYWLAARNAKSRNDWNMAMVSDLIFYGAMGVILGGRIGYVLFYQFQSFLQNPLYLLKIWEGGMSFHGGFLGVIIAMWLFARQYQKPVFNVLDFIVICVPMGLFFGRIGNFINGELWGRVSYGGYDWLMLFPQAWQADAMLLAQDSGLQTIAVSMGNYFLLPRHPSQLYQALTEGLFMFGLVWWFSRRPRPRMAMSGLFVLAYGVARFITEFFRQPDADQGFVLLGWVTKGQMLSFPMIIFGLVLLILAYQKKIFDDQR